MEDYEGAEEIERAWREGLTPDPLLSVSEWSDQHRMLSSKASAEPGRWRTSRTPYLKDIMDCLSPTSPVERVVFMKAAQLGAPLALTTPVPTPEGWTTMGEVGAGDYVFDEKGWPVRVLGVSDVLHDRTCYEIEFEDGERVVADAEHRWPVGEYSYAGRKEHIATTAEMVGRERFTSGKRWRYSIDVCSPVELPDRPLPIHPYLLGLWLGDGSSWMNHISIHEDDSDIVKHLADCGVDAIFRLPKWRKGKCANVVIDPTFRIMDDDGVGASCCGSSRFSVMLRKFDLLCNKHVPMAYLRAGRKQRLDLVCGLMDSDGSITPDGSRCEFSNSDKRLVDAMVELLRSLGYKPVKYSTAARQTIIQGRESTRRKAWRVSWTAYKEEPMFRLERKIGRMLSIENGRLWKSRRRAVVAIRPVASVPVRCIAVDSPSHLFLCGKGWIPTHNTEMGSNWIGYVIHHAPGPMMAVWPTVDMAKRNSKQRIDPLIEESEALSALISPARSRDSGNTILAKEFRGGVLVMTGANSAVGLRSMPVRYLFLDEVDGYPLDVEGEGDAISLAEARTRTFSRRKIFIVSTPTISGVSAIEREFEASNQCRYFVPCPHCQHRQWLRFEQLRWDKGLPETAAYVCESCDKPIAEHHKTWMLERGEWRPMVPDAGVKTTGFHLSSLYSPVGWRSWRDIAAAWESAVSKESGSAAAIKTFKNTELGETWVEEGEAPDWQRLLERREDYRIGTVPAGGLLLVGAADVQKDRIEASVWAFGVGKECWLIEHRVLMGDTARDEVWRRLAEMLTETWTHESGASLPLVRFALDTGFATQEAYAFVRACRDPRVMAVKGVARGAALIGTPTAVDVTQGGRKLRRGIKLFSVTVSIAKLEFYNNLRKTADVLEDGTTVVYPAGYVHLPKIDAEFIQQLCAEQLITRRDRNGFAHREWQKMRERNEALDCFDSKTEVLTYSGWKFFEELRPGDMLATVNLETDLIEYQSPQQLISRHYQGPMLTVCGTRLNFSVTPNHRMVTFKKVFDRSAGKWRFDVPAEITLAKDLTIHHTVKIRANWQGNETVVVTIPASVKHNSRNIIHPQRRVCAKIFAEFLGWYAAEGTCRIVAVGGSVMRSVSIAQTKPSGRARITELLDQLPWTWHWTKTSATISCKQLYDYMQHECPGLHHEKKVPQWIKDADKEVIAAFLNGAIAGDGWIQNGHRNFASTSKRLADDVAELFFKLGGSPSVTLRLLDGWEIAGRSGEITLPQYHVRENNGRKSAALDGKGRQFMVKARDYNGMVYCATVPNGTLVVRRAGKMIVAGNCHVYCRAAAAAAGLDRFEERHWIELKKQLGIEPPDKPARIQVFDPAQATEQGGLLHSGTQKSIRRVIKSRWLSS